MSSLEETLSALSGETKAMILINEFHMQRMGLVELGRILSILGASDLERLGILELVRRLGPQLGLSEEETSRLATGLNNVMESGVGSTPTQIHSAPGRTIRVHRFDAPPPEPQPTPTFRVRRHENRLQQPPQQNQPPAATQKQPRKDESSGPFYGGGLSGLGARVAQEVKGKRILIADDDTRIRMVFRKRLEESGFLVEEAKDGQKAWDLIQACKPAVAILDMKMPGLHGLEILARLNTAGMNLPVVICSAYEQLQEEFIVATYPNLRYLVKPVPMDKLVATVKELIAAYHGA